MSDSNFLLGWLPSGKISNHPCRTWVVKLVSWLSELEQRDNIKDYVTIGLKRELFGGHGRPVTVSPTEESLKTVNIKLATRSLLIFILAYHLTSQGTGRAPATTQARILAQSWTQMDQDYPWPNKSISRTYHTKPQNMIKPGGRRDWLFWLSGNQIFEKKSFPTGKVYGLDFNLMCNMEVYVIV